MDESQLRPGIAVNNQFSKAPFFSGYNGDESQDNSKTQRHQSTQSQPFTSNQLCSDVSGFPEDHVTNQYTQQVEYSLPKQITATPNTSVREQSFGSMNEDLIDVQAASSGGSTYGNSENMQYYADPMIYPGSNLDAALPVDTIHSSYTSQISSC